MSSDSPQHHDSRPVLYFVSDVHLGGSPPPEEAIKRERLLALFDRVEREGGSLYILGDLFDFWFEYRTVIPATAFAVLARLEALAQTGVPVHYLGGNHDFWMEDFLRRESAVQVLPDGVQLLAQDRRLRLYHGDGLGSGDRGYKLLKKIFRSRLAIRLFRWIHPDIGIRLAMRTSGVSRHHTADHAVPVDRIFSEVVLPHLEAGDHAVLMGHHHLPVHLKKDAGEFLILGDWFHKYTCARLRGGSIELIAWPIDS